MTISQAMEDFFSWKSTNIKAQSVEAYRDALRPLLEYGDRDVGAVTLQDLTKLVHKVRLRGDDKMFLAMLKGYAKYCRAIELKFVHPDLIKLRRKEDPKNRVVATGEDIERMVDECGDTFLGKRNELIIRMLFDTGMRVSELTDIKLREIDENKNYIKIFTKKGGRYRYVMWTERTHRLMRSYLTTRKSINWKTENLFINRDGVALTPRGVQYMVSKMRDSAGLDRKVHPHSMRHSKAHRMLRAGATVKDVNTILGHDPLNLNATAVYLRLESQESYDTAEKFLELSPEIP